MAEILKPSGLITIENSPIIFSEQWARDLGLLTEDGRATSEQLDNLVEKNYSLYRAHTRWECVRLAPPFVEKGEGTGFGGYYVGVTRDGAEVVNDLVVLGQDCLDSITRLHPRQPGRRRRLLKVLRGEEYNEEALLELNDIFGSLLARLRVQLLDNYAGQLYRQETEELVRGSVVKLSWGGEDTLREQVVLPQRRNQGDRILLAAGGDLEQVRNTDAGFFISKIGLVVGNPLFRIALAKIFSG
jgi:hypothetical protein